MVLPILSPSNRRAHVIVFGNEKGGSGKSTAAMHVVVGLLRNGLKVGSIDLDARQGTLSHYVTKRTERAAKLGIKLPVPEHRPVQRANLATVADAQADERLRFGQAMQELDHNDVIIIDTPGSDQYLSRLGHTAADTLVTPINDSFVDLDLLAEIDPDTLKVIRPSIYSDMVWEQRKERAQNRQRPTDWIVMRNRLGHTHARNKEDVSRVIDVLQRRLGFRVAPGFGERVIFRELFLKGLTMLDIRESADTTLSMSHVAARQEVRALLRAIGITRESLERQRAGGAHQHAAGLSMAPAPLCSEAAASAMAAG